MAEESIDTLTIEISSDAAAAVPGLDKLKNSLGGLKTEIKGGISGFRTTANQLKALSEAVNQIDTPGLDKLDNLMGSLGGLKAVGNIKLTTTINQLKKLPEVATALNGVDWSGFKSSIEQAADAIDPLATKMNAISAGFSSLPTKIQAIISNTEKMNAVMTRSAKSYLKLGVSFYTIKRIGNAIVDLVESSADYEETYNMFSVAMGDFADEAKAYADTVNEIMGIDPKQWMQAQGVFQTLATGFGVANDRAAVMSQNLTQLGYDLSSFRNIPVEEVMQKVRSGFSGELEPLRNLGYDLSQAKLQAVALSLGIDEAVSSMTQAEKAELRYYAIMTQVTWVQGDMSRTLDSTQNQMRIMSSAIEQAGRALGNLLIPMLNKALPYVTAVANVLKDIMQSAASLFGYEIADVDFGSSTAAVAESTADGLDDATDSAKKLRSYLMGFDELNVISATDETGTGEDALGTGFGYELPTYDFIGDAVASKTKEIENNLKGILGITGDVDEWVWSIAEKLGKIKGFAIAIGAALIGWKLSNPTMFSIENLSNIMRNGGAGIVIDIATSIAGVSLQANAIEDALKNGVNGANLAETFGGQLLTVTSISSLGGKIADWITKAHADSKVSAAIEKIGQKFGFDTSKATGAALAGSVSLAVSGASSLVVGIYDAVTGKLDEENGALIAWSAAEIGAGIGLLFGPVGAAVGGLTGFALGLITDAVLLAKTDWDTFSYKFYETGVWLQNALVTVLNTITTVVDGVVNDFIAGIDWIIRGINKLTGWSLDEIGEITFNYHEKIELETYERYTRREEDDDPKSKWSNNYSGKLFIDKYANGGFPDEGQLFIARERGAEMVGTVGNHAAVANNDQIVEAVSAGVYQAVSAAMKQMSSGGAQSLNVYLDGKQIASSVRRANKERGASIMGNEVYTY